MRLVSVRDLMCFTAPQPMAEDKPAEHAVSSTAN